MNKSNVQKAINIMQRVIDRGDAFDMRGWQFTSPSERRVAEVDLHTCGQAACFGGWVAVSPEFQKDGGRVSNISGAPLYKERDRQYAIAEWLEVSTREAESLCGLEVDKRNDLYQVKLYEITPDMVIHALFRLLETGSVFPKTVDQS